MDAAEPPRIVFESTTACADGDRAEEVVRQALVASRAPGTGWIVTIRIASATSPGVSAKGEITDANGTSRARSELAGVSTDCAALAKAMSGWATEALQRQEQPLTAQAPPPPADPEREQSGTVPVAPGVPRPAGRGAEPLGSAVILPSSSLQPPVSGETSDYEMPALELGTGAFLMVGGAAGGYAGVAPFLIDEIADGVFLRPSVSLGQAVSVTLGSTWAAGRLDTCTRLPGRYGSRNGIQLDVCGGPDIGFSYISSGTQPGTPREGKMLPYVALGPSVDLRAEVGNLAVSLRVVSGLNVAHKGFVDVTGKQIDEATWSWRFELAFSGSIRRSRR